MSALTDFLTKQRAFNDRDDAATATISTAVQGITGDFAGMLDTIKKLQDSQGQVTPEDQALIDQIESQGAAISTKLDAASTALEALDASVPPVIPTS